MSRQRKDVPDRADNVPGNEQRKRHQDEADGDPEALARHGQRDQHAERDFDGEDGGGEGELTAERGVETIGMQDVLEPSDAVEEEDVVAKGLLHGVVDDRHQRDDRVERHQEQHRQHHEPGFVVPGLVHGAQAPDSTRRESRHRCADGPGIEPDVWIGRVDVAVFGNDHRERRAVRGWRAQSSVRPMSSTLVIDTGMPLSPSWTNSGRMPSSVVAPSGAF